MRARLVACAAAIVAAACGGWSVDAHAQKKSSAARWEREPTSVLGLELGAKIDPIDLPSCGGLAIRESAYGFCYTSRSGEIVTLGGIKVPEFQAGGIIYAGEVVAQLVLYASHDDYASAKAVLVERYGKPTSVRTTKTQTIGGGIFASEVLTWVGQNVTLTLEERFGRIDQSAARFVHRRSMLQQVERAAEQTKRSAGQL